MVIKLYISGISGNKEVKKKQQRVQMILDSKQINYEAIDITEPGKEKDKEFMQQNGKVRESLGKHPLPPQIFNDDDFCGDYEDFDLANEVDELEKFLHIETSLRDGESESKQEECGRSVAGNQKHTSLNSLYNPYDYHTIRITYDDVNGLKEEIIATNDLVDENKANEEVKKSEVNGNCESVPASESITENVETSTEEVAPEKEESSTQEKINEDGVEEKNEEKIDDSQEQEGKGEILLATEKGEENEAVEEEKDENVVNPNEGKSPPSEEDEEKEEREKVENEKKEEGESDNDSFQSEKLQEE